MSRLGAVRELYEGTSDRAHRFRYALLAFDIATIIYVIATSFSQHGPLIRGVDTAFGVVILVDFLARLLIERQKMRFFLRFATLADLVAMLSFLAPLTGEGLGFLRVLRTLRLLHSYQLTTRLRRDIPFLRNNSEVLMAGTNLGVFLFVMTGLIYATQFRSNPDISNYLDALYFTVTTLTTTGFGDIVLPGTWGRLISVVVMIFGVTLFLRLAQVLFRPSKVREECHSCGLSLHDADAVHCKHCGSVIHIDTEGQP
ncbi:ion channel [Salipiger marinus]|uniref:potassium channel family protein n=1 Tax=Salipiger marinus TaxID=555512 RepID=UPI001E4BA9EB|nr:potassium channel family protein [Salipiger manganoxidans]MCD1618522.1 potassium channel family protein [Salipiger manganoxidans]MEB3417879.1 potassium channel family protein [Salipiger manganoxidans]